MIVFISALHFTDGTTGDINLDPQAFRYFADDLHSLVFGKNAAGQLEKRHNINQVTLVLLGDIFDLVRSTRWQGLDESQRPWGREPDLAAINQLAGEILAQVELKNRESFGHLASATQQLRQAGLQVQTVYIPGNHDRLCNVFDDLRPRVRQLLQVTPAGGSGGERFVHEFRDSEHKVLAMHGYESDAFNFAGGEGRSQADYDRMPLGDVIVSELMALIAGQATRLGQEQDMSPDQLEDLRSRLEHIDNVRPLERAMDWVFNQVKDHEQFGKVVDHAVDQLLRRFFRIHFVRQALDGIPGGSALIALQRILELLPVEYEADIIAKIKGLWEQLGGSPKDIKLAMQELDKAAPGRDVRYVVMGHTHKALQAPVKQVCLGGGPPQIYLNTGT